MNPLSAWQKVVLQNYANFNGRARRSEYWHYFLANIIVYVGVALILARISTVFGVLLLLYWVAMIVPGIAVAVRRMHDVGKSGWWLLIGLVPFVGGILLLVWACSDSHRGANEWGVSEKYPA